MSNRQLKYLVNIQLAEKRPPTTVGTRTKKGPTRHRKVSVISRLGAPAFEDFQSGFICRYFHGSLLIYLHLPAEQAVLRYT